MLNMEVEGNFDLESAFKNSFKDEDFEKHSICEN